MSLEGFTGDTNGTGVPTDEKLMALVEETADRADQAWAQAFVAVESNPLGDHSEVMGRWVDEAAAAEDALAAAFARARKLDPTWQSWQ